MPATVSFVRPTFTDNDNLSASQFNAVAAASATVPDAGSSSAGVIKLAGVLGGTADAPALADNVVTLAKLLQVATGKFLGRTTAATGNVELLDLTAAGAALAAAADAAAQRTLLGLASMALQAASAIDVSGGKAALDAYAANIGTLAYGSPVTLNFATSVPTLQTLTLTGNLTLTTSNLAAGRAKLIRIVGDGSSRTLTLPGWKFLSGAAPTALAAGKTAELSLMSWGTTDADVHACYAVEE